MIDDPWHYPRHEFADRMYAVLGGGVNQAATLFGARRIGKTHFLLKDFAPLCEAHGHRVVYVDLWQERSAPLGVLLHEFDRAVRSRSAWRGAVGASAGGIKFKANVPGLGSVDLDAAVSRPDANPIYVLDGLFERLARDREPAVLLFDEFQEVAQARDGPAVVAAIRTSLNKRPGRFLSVFTGSSQAGLAAVFSARDAPFYRFAAPLALPPLDDGFVDHTLQVHRRVSRRELDRATALDVWHRLDRSPSLFRLWLTELTMGPHLSPDEAMAAVEERFAAEIGHGRIWAGLSPLQRAVARMVAEERPGLFGKEGAAFVEALTGVPGVSPARRQTAANTLVSQGVLEKWGRTYAFVDAVVRTFVLQRPPTDFRGGAIPENG